MAESSAHDEVLELLEQADWLAPLVQGLLRDPHEVDDVLQETWLEVLRHPPVGASLSSPRAWLARIARRIALRRRERESARRWRERAVARPESEVDAEALTERVRLQRELAAGVLELPEAYRTALTLRYFEGLSTGQLAERLGIGEEAARKRVSRGLEALRLRLDEANGGERERWMCSLALLVTPRVSAARSLPAGAAVVLVVTAVSTLIVHRTRRARAERPPSAESPALEPLTTERRPDARATPAVRLALGPDELVTPPAQRPSGRVLDPRGQPLEGVRVEAHAPDRSAEAPNAARNVEVLATATSDAAGHFALALAPGELCDLRVEHAPFGLLFQPERRAGAFHELQLQPGAALEVELRSRAGDRPVADAPYRVTGLWLDAGDERELLTGRSDARGRIDLARLPAGRVRLDVRAAPLADLSVVLELAAGERLVRRFELEAARTLRGRVSAAASGLPLAGATLVAAPGDFEDEPTPARFGRGWRASEAVTSDGRGAFTLALGADFVPPWLRISAPGHAPRTLQVDFEQELAIALAPAARLRGRVLLPDGSPAGGARLTAVTARGAGEADWRTETCAADGSFELDGLGAAAHVLWLEHVGARAAVAAPALAPGARHELGDLRLAPSEHVDGQVVDERGEALPEARLELELAAVDGAEPVPALARRLARSDEEGRFSFADLSPGRYRLRASAPGRHTSTFELASVAGGASSGARLELPRARILAGEVVEASGRPILNACAVLDAQGRPGEPRACVTGADGRFRFELDEPGPYALRVAPNSIHLEGGELDVHAVDVLGLELGQESVRVVLPPAAIIAGRLLSRSLEPRTGAMVFARDSEGRLATYESTDPDGLFYLRVRPWSVVDLSVRLGAEPERSLCQGIAAGRQDLELTLD